MKTKTEKKSLTAKQKLEILNTIAQRHDGALTPEIVLEEATNESHPLHSVFEWNDSLAAHQYRLSQAAMLIRTVKIKVQIAPNEERWTRAFLNVRDPEDDTSEDEQLEQDETGTVAEAHRGRKRGFYTSLHDALKVPAYKEQLLDDARRDLESFRRKYSTLTQLSGLIESIEEVLTAL